MECSKEMAVRLGRTPAKRKERALAMVVVVEGE
jgi:hypothetical protein